MTKEKIPTYSLDKAVEVIENAIFALLETKPFVTIAIDGRCAAGKTTLAAALQKKLACNVICCDDFFLPPEKRTEERLSAAGGNMDRERLLAEVILPLAKGKPFCYRPFDCHTLTYREPVKVTPNRITLIEGSYSCHDELWQYYDLPIFLDVDKETQRKRILHRNGEGAEIFFEKWIPLEERYFATASLDTRAKIALMLTEG